MLIVAYGVGRVLMVLFAQFRDVWFTVVAQNAVRQLAYRTFRHLHELSLRFHLERRTGGLNRVIERGVAGVDTIVRMAVLNSIPTAVELLMIAGLVAYYFGWIYVVVVLYVGCAGAQGATAHQTEEAGHEIVLPSAYSRSGCNGPRN